MAYYPPGGNPYGYFPSHPGQGPPRPPVWPMPNASGGYNPYGNMPYNPAGPSMSYGQSLFRPQATPENYTYGQAHQTGYSYQPMQVPAPPPPIKRQRLDNGQGVNSGALPLEATGAAWRNCSQPGCKFVGSGKDVEIHEEDRHLIYRPGKQPQRSEEEERFAKRKGPPPPIEGTNITLTTPEDIEKWIAERKAKWPSSKRVAEKEAEHKAAVERGELPARGGKRGRGRGGIHGGRANDPAAQAEDWGRAPVERTEREIGNRGRGRERGRGRGGRADRGRGGGHQGDQGRGQDQGWAQKQPQASTTSTHATQEPSAADSALAGMGDYGSSDDMEDASSDSTSSSESSSESDSSSESESEDDEDVQPIAKGATEPDVAPPKSAKPVCKFFAKSGRCNRGDRCHFAHTAPIAPPGDKPVTNPQSERRKLPRQPPAKRANPFERPSMLGALLANPIQNTLSQLSQTIRFLVANDMLENVELQPGQAEDIERENNKVIVIDEQHDDSNEGLE